jgi:hypothetical protein
MKTAIAISGNWRLDHFRRACSFYSEVWNGYDLYLCTNYIENEFSELYHTYKSVKGFKVLGENNGFHAGAIDVINGALSQCLQYDRVISIHCDVVLVDRPLVENWLFSENLKGLGGTQLRYGNQGINTEFFLVNMATVRDFLPIKNLCLPPTNLEAEACLKSFVESLPVPFLFLSSPRGSYGYFREIGLVHMHNPQTPEDSSLLGSLGYGEFSISNFQTPMSNSNSRKTEENAVINV